MGWRDRDWAKEPPQPLVTVAAPEKQANPLRVVEADWESVRVRVVPPAGHPLSEEFAAKVRAGCERWLAGEVGSLLIPPGFALEILSVSE